MNQNKIIVLLATYNGEKYLKEQLDSLLSQTINVSVLIRDDNSTDSTLDIIKQYTQKYENITMLSDSKQSSSAKENFSILLEYAYNQNQYDYFMFCDQDDVWFANKVEITLAKMKESEKESLDIPVLIHTDLQVVDESLKVLDKSYWSYQHINPRYDTFNRLLMQNVVTGCTAMANKSLVNKALPVPKDVLMHDWWLGLVAKSFGEVYPLEESTLLYRQHEHNDTGASVFGFGMIVNRAKSIFSFDCGKYIAQAKLFYIRYKDDLTLSQKSMLENFISSETKPWHKKKMILLKQKILKQGFIRNIGLLLCK